MPRRLESEQWMLPMMSIFFQDLIWEIFEMLSIPFAEGEHFFESVDQALAIVAQLRIIHAADCVHGDIRGLNIVFDKTAEFIDFDFGGTAGVVRFPSNYRRSLPDGNRSLGIGGQPITKEHDVQALARVLGSIHKQALPEEKEDNEFP